MEITLVDKAYAEDKVSKWCKQAVLFAIMVRARDMGKPIPTSFGPDAMIYAGEVFQKVLSQAGSIELFDDVPQWMTAVVDAQLRWVQNHLDR